MMDDRRERGGFFNNFNKPFYSDPGMYMYVTKLYLQHNSQVGGNFAYILDMLFYQLKRTPDDFICLINESNGYTGE